MVFQYIQILIIFSLANIFFADDCPSSFNIQTNATDISFQTSPTLLIILSKYSYKLSIIDLPTQTVLLQSSRDIFAGVWEGAYETLYFGYMFRVGYEKEHRIIGALKSYSCSSSSESITFSYNDFYLTFIQQENDRTIHLQIEYTGFNEHFDINPSHYVFPFLTLSFKTRDIYEDYYGFGSYWGFTRFRGQKLYCWSEDGSWSFLNISTRIPQANATYIPMPLFISNRQYAVSVNETRRVNFDLSSSDEWIITTEWNRTDIQFYFPIKNSFLSKTKMSKPFENFFNLYKQQNRKINPSFTALIQARGETTRIPPLFVFGPWKQTGNVLKDHTEVDVVQRMIEQDIPITVRIGVLHFFPTGNQQGHEDEIRQENAVYKELGVTSLCYFNPYISTSYKKLFDECLENDYLLKNSSNQPYLFPYFGDIISRHFYVGSVDFSNKNASLWYQKQIQQSFDLGYNGFMLDFGEYTPVNSISSNGKTGHEMHNRFIELYQKTVYEMTLNSTTIEQLLNLNSNEKNSLSINYQSDFLFYTRSGYTNSAQYTQLHWTGDASSDWNPYSGLPAHVQACLGIGISGIPYCSSPIGGYVCEFYPDLTVELLTRWLQVGTFSGFMHDETEGSACTQERIQLFTNNQTVYVWRKYAKLRTQLFPYIFTLAHEAHATGLPITRHHLLTYYNDEIAIQQEYQYTFGNDILVAPIVNKNQFLQDVYLPSGENWIDLSTNLIYDQDTDGRYRIGRSDILHGGQWIMNVKADLLTIPLFARAGSIIPLIDPSVFTLNPGQPVSIYDRFYILHLWIFLNEQNEANGLVWDGLNINMNACNLNKSLCINIDDPQHRLLILQLPFNKPAKSISSSSVQSFEQVSNWQIVAKILPREQLQNCFTYDEENQVIWIAIVLLQQQSSFKCQIDF
ncbi:unnamed protein product [Rotaria sp. Silwood2]|nr:unnamed protein product [Rotaria sp. Silwood2]CAF2932797.1 unnamed protein product [Rotaria sp. Silwood2]CAF4085378.1 unnamed protein product [Rotaria sp. Silwood2]CAF4553284.1 unnamed protein product [Rotaria sp. Silwood2]